MVQEQKQAVRRRERGEESDSVEDGHAAGISTHQMALNTDPHYSGGSHCSVVP